MPNNQTRIPKDSKLLKIKTDFRNLKYSQDLRGGGSSGMPFIKSPIPENATEKQKENYKLVESGADIGNLRRGLDSSRISAFLSTNDGKEFTRTQKLLQFQNPKTEVGGQIRKVDNTGKTFFGGLINNFLNGGVVEYTRVFNNNNLLTQVGHQGTGIHFDRQGNTPVAPYQSTYYYRVKNKDTQENRLVLLKNTKIDTTRFISSTSANVGSLNDTGISKKTNLLFEYLGGPGSNSENSFTVIQRADYTNQWSRFKYPSFPVLSKAVPSWEKTNYSFSELLFPSTTAVVTADSSRLISILKRVTGETLLPGGDIYTLSGPNGQDLSVKRYKDSTLDYNNATNADNFDTRRGTTSDINRAKTMTYSQIAERSRNLNNTIRQDFRNGIEGIPSTDGYDGNLGGLVNINNGGNGYLDNVYGVGTPGSINIKRVDYSTVGKGSNDQGVDRINSLDVGETYSEGNRDLIKCIITAVETQQNTDTLTTVFTPMVFRAFVTNFSDSINASYNEHQYVGRGEKFYTYNNADRKVNFELAIAAQSRVEMAPLYRKLNYLISQLYPGYSGFADGTGNGFMRAPLVKMTIGDYLSDQPGFLNSINISVPEESPWEIKADMDGKDSDMYQLPHYLKLTIQFTPIHNFLARRAHKSEARGYVIPTFITPNETVFQPNGEINGNNLFNIG